MANYAVGFDNIDVDACTRHGVLASNTPEVLTETTADAAFALMITAARCRHAASFFTANLGWGVEETGSADDRHHWAVLRTRTDPGTRPSGYLAGF